MHDAAWILTAWLAVKLSRFNGYDLERGIERKENSVHLQG